MSASNSHSRIFALDALKCLAIFLVLWGHAIQYCGSKDATQGLVYVLIYTFHMPLFMMVSGFFSASSMSLSFKDMLGKKFRQLLVPVIVGCMVIMPLTFCISYFIGFGVFLTHYWFLKSLFICYLLLWCALRLKNVFRSTFLSILLSLMVALFIPIYNVGLLYPSFLIGYYLFKNRIILQTLGWPIAIGALVLYASSARILFQFETSMGSLFYQILIILRGIGGAVFFIMLFMKLLNNVKADRPIPAIVAKVGRETLGIYILQTIILEIIIARFLGSFFGEIDKGLFSVAIAPIISLIVLCVIMALIAYIGRSPLLSMLFLGRGKLKNR